MRNGFEIPDDGFIIKSMLEATDDSIAMAVHLVSENGEADGLSAREVADVSVLCAVLPFLKEHGIREIHRFVDMPFPMFQRWNQSINSAIEKGLIPNRDSISESDFEDMMNG
tara:strand:- start:132 stop:467 length:336 start_codon:yes stop_codon:yes gene_type:complete